MKEIKDQIQAWTKMLPTGSFITPGEAERRAGEFLVALAHIAEWTHIFKEAKIKASSVQVGVFAEEMSKSDSKLVTEKKAMAEASSNYIQARESLEFTENDISYLKAYQEIFTNSHVFYRQLSKENQ